MLSLPHYQLSVSEDILARIDEIREMSGGEAEHLSMLQVNNNRHHPFPPDGHVNVILTYYPCMLSTTITILTTLIPTSSIINQSSN